MMLSCTKSGIGEIWRFFIACVVAFVCLCPAGISSGATKQKGFSTAEDAVGALISSLKDNNEKELLAILGTEAKELIFSGDAVVDRETRKSFVEDYDQKNSLSEDGGKKVLVIGEQEWPFPIPLVRKNGKWFFDTKAGREEILDRRIGRNELDTIQTMRAIVDAQREYAMNDRDGDGVLEYAEKFGSDPGKKNGLYWVTKQGEEPSPLGELVAKAREEGYGGKGSKGKAEPYHGYYYRILTSQGKHANGGAFDYIVNGKMIGGFAVVAYPAAYGNSGVMTFVVNYDDVVFQKDLGKETEKLAKNMKRYDPDKTWEPVK